MVAGEVITHFVEHKVLDQDFDAVSDDMTLWYGHGTVWQTRWPDCYTEAPVTRQPTMDVLTPLMSGLPRPEEVQDVVDSAQRVIMRVEPFKLHTIERERLLDEKNRNYYRIPDIKDAFMADKTAIEASKAFIHYLIGQQDASGKASPVPDDHRF